MAGKQKRMGRGLDMLINDGDTAKKEATKKPAVARAVDAASVQKISISKIKIGPWQPRHTFDSDALEELVLSVKEHGILQPLLVRELDGAYELIAGERRLRAAQAALFKTVPVLVIGATDKKALEIALIENLQREDLNPIEEAKGYALLQEKFELTQEGVAKQVGKARASIANTLRLLELPDNIRKGVAERSLSVGHAKVILSVASPQEQALLAKRVLKEGLSVRALEKLVKRLNQEPKKARSEKKDLPADYLHTLTDELHQYFGTRVRVTPSTTLASGRKVKGSLEVDFHDNEELDRLLTLMGYTTAL